MNIVKHEHKKIITSPSLIGFVITCILLNILLVFSARNSYADYIAEVSYKTGVRMGAEFDRQVENLTPSEYSVWLQMQTEGITDVFDDYNAKLIGEAYVNAFNLYGIIANLMVDKYERLQTVVERNTKTGVGMDLYFAGATYDRHTQLFRVIMTVLLFEGILLISLTMLLSLGHEFNTKTEFTVYATKTGRRVNRAKLISCILTGLLIYIFLSIVTLLFFFLINPLGAIGGSSVSSGFNYVHDLVAGVRPFITWFDLNVIGYVIATVCASAGVILCFGILSYITGLWIRNGYIGFLIIALINFAIFVLPFTILGTTLPTYFLTLSPIWIVLQQGVWFTDGGSNVLLPHFEIVGIIASLVILAPIATLSSSRFKRKNLV
ncbi:MAG: hypothetical protein LBC71_05220 [Oscillospiraceae bacterium]|jgi:hypothetical protein|nr:hypothetical protein [Oscillospiraceae bacterium]